MPHDDSFSSARHSVLCVRSRRTDTFADEVIGGYQACVLHDARLACRKAQLGIFDIYLAIDLRSNDAPLYLWRNIRAFDRNTPFVFVLSHGLPEQVQSTLRPECEAAIVAAAPNAWTVKAAIERLLSHAEEHSLEARRLEALAVQRDITERLASLELRVNLSRQSLARAQEHVMRAVAIREFLRSGGTKAQFERYWADTFESALRDSYAERRPPTRNDREQPASAGGPVTE